jgi:subtilisin family serine protease
MLLSALAVTRHQRPLANVFHSSLIKMESVIMTTTFDVVSDFNHTGVQPAVGYPFTYGTETALNVGFTLLPYYGNTNASGTWSIQTGGTVDNYYFGSYQFAGPSVGVVATGGTLTFPASPALIVPNDVLCMMPGGPEFNAPDLLVTRFTAPSAGLFDIAGSFTDLQVASVGLTILIDGVPVFSDTSFTGSSAYQGTVSFSIHGMSLAQGATIDFVVDSLAFTSLRRTRVEGSHNRESPEPGHAERGIDQQSHDAERNSRGQQQSVGIRRH